MPGTLGRAAMALSLLATSTAYAKPYPPPPMPPGYDNPGPKPENALPQIVAKLSGELRDSSSIRDFVLCEPSAQPASKPLWKSDTWHRAYWSAMFALNAKNAYGGYTGRERWTARFADGAVERLVTGRLGSSGLDAQLNALADKLLESCQGIPDAEIQRLLAN